MVETGWNLGVNQRRPLLSLNLCYFSKRHFKRIVFLFTIRFLFICVPGYLAINGYQPAKQLAILALVFHTFEEQAENGPLVSIAVLALLPGRKAVNRTRAGASYCSVQKGDHRQQV